MTIRKVSEYQITMAALILAGERVITWQQVGCARKAWAEIRCHAKLKPLDAQCCAVMPESRTWALAVHDHQESLASRRRETPRELARRKWLRVQRKLAEAGG